MPSCLPICSIKDLAGVFGEDLWRNSQRLHNRYPDADSSAEVDVLYVFFGNLAQFERSDEPLALTLPPTYPHS